MAHVVLLRRGMASLIPLLDAARSAFPDPTVVDRARRSMINILSLPDDLSDYEAAVEYGQWTPRWRGNVSFNGYDGVLRAIHCHALQAIPEVAALLAQWNRVHTANRNADPALIDPNTPDPGEQSWVPEPMGLHPTPDSIVPPPVSMVPCP